MISGSGVKSIADNIDGLVKEEAAMGFILVLGTQTGFTAVDRYSLVEVAKARGMATNHRQCRRSSLTQADCMMKVLPMNVESIMKGGGLSWCVYQISSSGGLESYWNGDHGSSRVMMT